MSPQELVADSLARIEEIRALTPGIDEAKLQELISYIAEGEVIPIVGQELVRATVFGTDQTLYQALATELAKQLRVPAERLGERYTLTDVTAANPAFAKDRQLICKKLHGILNTEPFSQLVIPKPLRQLSLINGFRLFVSTTFDTYLEKALNEARFAGESGTLVRAFSPYTPVDLSGEDTEAVSPPVIFKLFGQVSERADSPYFAATDGDMVEFLHHLQYDKRPKQLFGELKKRHLLILGTDYPNWLARFFLRITRDSTLWAARDKQEYFSDRQLGFDKSLVAFIQYFCKDTQCFPQVEPVAFVERLFAEWMAADPQRALFETRPAPNAPVVRAEESVFLSYVREDQEDAYRIKTALESIGWQVFFDRKDLESGVDFEKKIERSLKAARACVILLSPNSVARSESFFRLEWSWALEWERRFTGMPRRFIHPLRLTKDTPMPMEFKSSHNSLVIEDSLAINGAPPKAFLDEMARILRQVRKERH